MQIKIKRLHPGAIIPQYATPGAACFDLHTVIDAVVRPGKGAILPTGLAFQVPHGHVMLVYSRSGHGFKYGVRLANGTGVIDSDYRGEIMVKLHNDNSPLDAGEFMSISAGDRIAQAMIVPIIGVEFVEDELSETARGIGGFGSTGQ